MSSSPNCLHLQKTSVPISNCQLVVSFRLSYDYLRPDSLQGQFIMALAYGYDLKDGDKILDAPIQVGELMSPLVLPGAVLVNYLPFCAILRFIPTSVSQPFQCGTFLHGSRTSVTNHLRENLGS